jgi:hypothetical protein
MTVDAATPTATTPQSSCSPDPSPAQNLNDGNIAPISSSNTTIDYAAIREENLAKQDEFLRSIGLVGAGSSRRSNNAVAGTTSTRQKISKSIGSVGVIESQFISSDEIGSASSFKQASKQGKRNAELHVKDEPQISEVEVRRSKRVRGVTANNDLEVDEHDNTVLVRVPYKPVRDTGFVEIDDEESVRRTPITARLVRDVIAASNDDHDEIITDEQLQHCVLRIQTMSNKALGTRIKMITRYVCMCYVSNPLELRTRWV